MRLFQKLVLVRKRWTQRRECRRFWMASRNARRLCLWHGFRLLERSKIGCWNRPSLVPAWRMGASSLDRASGCSQDQPLSQPTKEAGSRERAKSYYQSRVRSRRTASQGEWGGGIGYETAPTILGIHRPHRTSWEQLYSGRESAAGSMAQPGILLGKFRFR